MSAVVDRHAWLQERRNYLGGSDQAALLGLSPWRTPLDVYLEKVGQSEFWEGNEATYWGNQLEDLVAQEYAKRTGSKIRRNNRVLVHPKYDFLRANLDREVVGVKRVLECKTAGLRSADHWGEDGTDEVPDYYLPQVTQYMAIRGAQGADIAVLIGGQDFRVYHIERDPELEELVLETAVRFWEQHVIPRVPPPPMNANDVVRLFPRDDGLAVDATTDLIHEVEELRAAKAEIARLEKIKDHAEERIKTVLGEHAVLRGPDGKPLVTWKAAKDAQRFDAKRFAKEHPDLFAQYQATFPGSRRFLVK